MKISAKTQGDIVSYDLHPSGFGDPISFGKTASDAFQKDEQKAGDFTNLAPWLFVCSLHRAALRNQARRS